MQISPAHPKNKLFRSTYLLLIPLFCFTSSFANPELPAEPDNTQVIRAETTAGLQSFFQTLDYDWQQLDTGVPPLILENFPHDIDVLDSTETKKRTFFMGLLPMVLLANQEIEKEREEILRILQRRHDGETQFGDRERLNELMKRYGLRGHPYIDHRVRSRLLRRVDTIPPALVLAQAANESSWGTSRFARLGNNLFGEWTYRTGTGIVPKERPPGEVYEVRKFASLYESIRSYMNNLNRNGAYRELRRVREKLRKENRPVTGMALAEGLRKYSQRGEEYIREIRAMIRHNRLSQTNLASIRQPDTEGFTGLESSGSGLFSTRNRLIGHLALSGSYPQLAEPVP